MELKLLLPACKADSLAVMARLCNKIYTEKIDEINANKIDLKKSDRCYIVE